MKRTRTVWYASGGGIRRSGPYAKQMEAYTAMLLTDEARREQRAACGTDSPYPRDVLVWPEYIVGVSDE